MKFTAKWKCPSCKLEGYSIAEEDGLAVLGTWKDHKIVAPNCKNESLYISIKKEKKDEEKHKPTTD